VSYLRFKQGPNLPNGDPTEDVRQLRSRSEMFIEKNPH
jgi:hypothetical protein